MLFADEPTGALDTRSSRAILELLREANRSEAMTIVMVTHDPVAASFADRIVLLADGRIIGELPQSDPAGIAGRLARLEEVAPW